MREPKPYALADKAITLLTRKAIQRNDKAKKRLLLADFDELNVVREVDILYEGMDADNRARYKDLFIARYAEMLLYLGKKVPDEDTLDELAELYITRILFEPDEVTHYIYDTEVYRKRDREKEAVNAVSGAVIKQKEMDKHLRYWSQMTQQYADTASDEAAIDAMKRAGIKKVRWNTQKDNKVCNECDELDGQIFDIDKAPGKKHWRCRCWLSPVK